MTDNPNTLSERYERLQEENRELRETIMSIRATLSEFRDMDSSDHYDMLRDIEENIDEGETRK